jgi:hypothetical protein
MRWSSAMMQVVLELEEGWTGCSVTRGSRRHERGARLFPAVAQSGGRSGSSGCGLRSMTSYLIHCEIGSIGASDGAPG